MKLAPLLLGALCAGAIGSAALARPADPLVALFAQGAGTSNAFEIAEARIILEDSTNPVLRQFAEDMVRDHAMAQRDLRMAGGRAGVATDFVFDKTDQAKVDALGLMDGQTLDSTYLTDQVASHASAAATLQSYAASGTDPALRAYARKTLPVVLMHQHMLEAITGQPKPM